MRSVLWQTPDAPGADRCSLRAIESGYALDGTALLVRDGCPFEVRYSVRVDNCWRTRSVLVQWDGLTDSASALVDVQVGSPRTTGTRQPRWFANGVHKPQLDGCLDVDLEFTPATNMLPVRRLELAEGSSTDLDVAWLRFPSLALERSAQRYERLGASTYRFAVDGFDTRIEFDEVGLVRAYGPHWRQVAAHDDTPPQAERSTD